MEKKIELLAPAGNYEKLMVAFKYGADAVYIGGKSFSLRAKTENFSSEQIKEALAYTKKNKKKLYITMNIFATNEDMEELEKQISTYSSFGVDGLIVSDPGVVKICKNYPDIKIILSTQANTTNFVSANFWAEQGVGRVILARELSLKEIKEIVLKTKIETEVFIHGALCISYSGRCFLSKYLNNRDANRGECSHPCRWSYQLVEEKRPGQYFQVDQEEKGSHIFNSKDLCLINYIPDLIEAGVTSLKIEGRMKSLHYVATTVGVYRQVIDSYLENPKNFSVKAEWQNELQNCTKRGYTENFINGEPTVESYIYKGEKNQYLFSFVGIVLDHCDGFLKIDVRNKINKDDEIFILSPAFKTCSMVFSEIFNEKKEKVETANPGMVIFIKGDVLEPLSLLRKKVRSDTFNEIS